MSPVSEKQEFQNQSGGWLGVVVIGPKGDDRGVSVAPGASVWLSEEEQVLTANAPRKAADNPFVEQTFTYTESESGESKTQTYIPLVPVDTGRYVPAQTRPIGRDISNAAATGAAQVAATGDEPVQLTSPDPIQQRAEEIAASDSSRPVPPARARAAAEATEEPPEAPAAPEPPAQPPVEPPAPEQPTAPVEEETAVQQPTVPEETGAAVPPTGEAIAGSFSQGEEVGTPLAPSETAAAPPEQPAPWTPQERDDQPEAADNGTAGDDADPTTRG